MRKLFLIAVVFITGLVSAQAPLQTDTIKERLRSLDERTMYLENAFVELRNNMMQCQREHSVGIVLSVVGLAATGLSFTVKDDDIAKYVAIGGGVISLIGFTVILDSHKWIGYCGDIPLRGRK